LQPVLVNGSAGVIATADGRPLAVMSFTVADGRIIEIDSISDPSRLPGIAAAAGLTG
jgi:RNA polymerase sigma-70 factor (ECF subfamily)